MWRIQKTSFFLPAPSCLYIILTTLSLGPSNSHLPHTPISTSVCDHWEIQDEGKTKEHGATAWSEKQVFHLPRDLKQLISTANVTWTGHTTAEYCCMWGVQGPAPSWGAGRVRACGHLLQRHFVFKSSRTITSKFFFSLCSTFIPAVLEIQLE